MASVSKGLRHSKNINTRYNVFSKGPSYSRKCFMLFTYVRNCSLQSFSQDYLPSFSHHLCCVCVLILHLQFQVVYERQIFWELFHGNFLFIFIVFFFSTKKCTLYLKKKKQKNFILCLFFKNVSPSQRVVCFILNNLHFPMGEGIAFYALYKSKVLIIPCKADDSCLGLPDES